MSATPRHRRWEPIPAKAQRYTVWLIGAGHAADIYEPVTTAAGLAWRLGRWLADWGAAQAVVAWMTDRTTTPPAWVAELLDERVPGWTGAMALPSHEPARWTVGVADAGGLARVVKVAAGDNARLRHEAAVLGEVASRRTDFRVPRLLGHDSGDRRTWLDLAPVTAPPAGTPALAWRVARSLGRLGIVHGDLAPWNLRGEPDAPVLLDWEFADLGVPGGAPLAELLHYLSVAPGTRGSPRRISAEAAAVLGEAPHGRGAAVAELETLAARRPWPQLDDAFSAARRLEVR